jgi:3-dehydroquinate dehydratase-2
MAKILLLNGPNLNLLGRREPKIYGSDTLDSIYQMLSAQSQQLGHELEHCQSNAEHVLVETIQQTQAKFIIFNPAAFTHSSIALRDALSGVNIPFIEIHISNIFAREEFRQHSFLSDIAVGVISGLGITGYALALTAADHYLKTH